MCWFLWLLENKFYFTFISAHTYNRCVSLRLVLGYVHPFSQFFELMVSEICVTLFHFQLILIVLLNFAWLNLEWKVLFRTDSSNTRVCFKSLPFTNSKIMKLNSQIGSPVCWSFQIGSFLKLISNPHSPFPLFTLPLLQISPKSWYFFTFVEVTRKETIKFFSTWS